MVDAIDEGLIKALEEIVAKDRTGFGRAALANVARKALSRHKAPLSVTGDDVAPIPMMLFCPKCGLQHIDMPDPTDDWDNPPHKSHKCVGPNGCGTVWRPADVPTEGVAAIQTRGSKDTVFYNHAALTTRQPVAEDDVERAAAQYVSDRGGHYGHCCSHRLGHGCNCRAAEWKAAFADGYSTALQVTAHSKQEGEG